MSFKNLNLNQKILRSIEEEGYTQPTPIQSKAIPEILAGKDLLACAQTGTGKTAAFALPIINFLSERPADKNRKIKALIVTPTRELAIQIDESFKVYGRYTQVSHTVIFGGVSQHQQVQNIKGGKDIVTATPGRLLDLIQQGFIDLKTIEYFILDEADRMLDMGFINDIRKIIKLLPSNRQSLFFSATMPPDIVELSNKILRNPVKVEVTPVSSTAETIQQTTYFVEKQDKTALMLDLLKNPEMNSVLVFARTKHGADKLVKSLNKYNVEALAIHGNKSQNARQNALNRFKQKTCRVLIATDIAARGIDVEELEWVINYELPNVPETYVHRIGRSGRAGNKGNSISFCSVEERPYLKDIEKLIKLKIPVVQHAFESQYTEPIKIKRSSDDVHYSSNHGAGKKPFRGGSNNNSNNRTGGGQYGQNRPGNSRQGDTKRKLANTSKPH